MIWDQYTMIVNNNVIDRERERSDYWVRYYDTVMMIVIDDDTVIHTVLLILCDLKAVREYYWYHCREKYSALHWYYNCYWRELYQYEILIQQWPWPLILLMTDDEEEIVQTNEESQRNNDSEIILVANETEWIWKKVNMDNVQYW